MKFFTKGAFVLAMLLLYISTTAQISRQPYLQKATTTSMLIAWRSSTAQSFELRYGTDAINLSNSLMSPSGTAHGLSIENLSPFTQYFYQILDENGTALTETTFFYTAKPDYEPSTDMLVFGDCGVANNDQYAVRDLMQAESENNNFDFGIVCGDVSQGDGTEYDNVYFDVYENFLKNRCLFTAIGNHDLYGYPFDNGTAQQFLADFYQFTNNPQNTEEYYSFEYGNAKLICLHTNFENQYEAGSAQYEWLVNELSCRTTEWVFVYFHQPPYANGWGLDYYIPFTPYYLYDGEDKVREDLVPVFEQYDVDFVFNGHMHGYERGELNGVHYVTSGGAGGGLDDKRSDWSHITVNNYEHHYLLVNLNDTTLNVRAINTQSQVIDEFTVHKNRTGLIAAFDLPETICANDAPIVLQDVLHPNATIGGTWSGTGVTDNGNGLVVFDPSGLEEEVVITYTLDGSDAACTKSVSETIVVSVCTPLASVPIKVLLEGVYDPSTDMMLTGLLDAGKLPSVQPFSGNPWLYTGIEDVSSASANGFYPNTVDWVLVELRDANDVTTVIASAAALLLADGQIVDVYDTTANGVVFNVPTDVPYYIAVKSRNHLATVSAEPVMIGTPYDFSTAVTQAMGENQLKILSSGGYAQYAGDINGNGIINYKDFNAYLLQITNTTYKSADINMDGQVNLVDFNWYLGNASTIGVTAIRY